MRRLVHISDIHMPHMPNLYPYQLLNKRITGYLFWKKRRQFVHQKNALETVTEHMLAQKPDHILCSGDLTNFASKAEINWAKTWLSEIESHANISLVPGNHDAYVPGALNRVLEQWNPWIKGQSEQDDFPFVHEISLPNTPEKGIAVFCLSSAIATRPFNAQGKIGAAQLERLAALFKRYSKENWFQLVMLHHPPLAGLTKKHRILRDEIQMTEALQELAPHLVVYGHNHRHQCTHLTSQSHSIPVIGVRSASCAPQSQDPEAGGYNIYEVDFADEQWKLTCEFMGFTDQKEIISPITENLVHYY